MKGLSRLEIRYYYGEKEMKNLTSHRKKPLVLSLSKDTSKIFSYIPILFCLSLGWHNTVFSQDNQPIDNIHTVQEKSSQENSDIEIIEQTRWQRVLSFVRNHKKKFIGGAATAGALALLWWFWDDPKTPPLGMGSGDRITNNFDDNNNKKASKNNHPIRIGRMHRYCKLTNKWITQDHYMYPNGTTKFVPVDDDDYGDGFGNSSDFSNNSAPKNNSPILIKRTDYTSKTTNKRIFKDYYKYPDGTIKIILVTDETHSHKIKNLKSFLPFIVTELDPHTNTPIINEYYTEQPFYTKVAQWDEDLERGTPPCLDRLRIPEEILYPEKSKKNNILTLIDVNNKPFEISDFFLQYSPMLIAKQHSPLSKDKNKVSITGKHLKASLHFAGICDAFLKKYGKKDGYCHLRSFAFDIILNRTQDKRIKDIREALQEDFWGILYSYKFYMTKSHELKWTNFDQENYDEEFLEKHDYNDTKDLALDILAFIYVCSKRINKKDFRLSAIQKQKKGIRDVLRKFKLLLKNTYENTIWRCRTSADRSNHKKECYALCNELNIKKDRIIFQRID